MGIIKIRERDLVCRTGNRLDKRLFAVVPNTTGILYPGIMEMYAVSVYPFVVVVDMTAVLMELEYGNIIGRCSILLDSPTSIKCHIGTGNYTVLVVKSTTVGSIIPTLKYKVFSCRCRKCSEGGANRVGCNGGTAGTVVIVEGNVDLLSGFPLCVESGRR